MTDPFSKWVDPMPSTMFVSRLSESYIDVKCRDPAPPEFTMLVRRLSESHVNVKC
jgi:hypothetical protein